jgi:hypothetical protein
MQIIAKTKEYKIRLRKISSNFIFFHSETNQGKHKERKPVMLIVYSYMKVKGKEAGRFSTKTKGS